MTLSVVLLTSAPAWRGSGTSLAKIAAGLNRAGHRSLILAGNEAVRSRFASEGLAVRQVPLEQTGWRELRALAAELRAAGADLVLADMARDLRLTTLATIFRPVPLLFRYNLSRRVLREDPVSRLLYRRVAAIAWQSAYARARALGTSPWLGSRCGEVIPNGFDGARFRPDPDAGAAFRAGLGLSGDTHLVLSGAALFFDKGYATALDAIARARVMHPLEYVICGAGDDAAAITARAATLGLPVRFVGQLAPPDWSAALNAADVVLHPGSGELFSNVVAEAMLRARPIVAVDSGATPEILGRDGRAGVLVPEDDAGAMAAAVVNLLQGAPRRNALGQAARARVLVDFPLDRMERGYVHLIEGVVLARQSLPVGPSAQEPVR